MTKEDEGDIQITISYVLYRRIHSLSKVAGKSPEELVEEAVQVYIKNQRLSSRSHFLYGEVFGDS